MHVSPAIREVVRLRAAATAGAWIRWILAGMLLGGLAGVASGQIRVVAPTETPSDEFSQVHLPTDRSLARAMERAERRLRDGEYHDVLVFFQQILERQEDSFLDDESATPAQVGLKATARRLIATLPPKGQDTYELLYGTAARRRLDEALAAGDEQAVAEVVRRYFHTSAGQEAALVLAQMEADRGHYLTAAQTYQQLLEVPTAADRFEPQLSVLAAVTWATAGDRERAADTMRSLAQRMPGATVNVAGRALPMPRPDDDQLTWLVQLVGQPKPVDVSGEDWPTKRGDLSRNARRRGGAPHLRPRWEARVVTDPKVESLLANRRDQLSHRGVVAMPAASPIAVGDTVLVRTPQNLVAIDWRTGKRIWETRPEEVEDPQASADFLADASPDWSEMSQPLEDRVWDDALAASLASDGERVFAICGLPLTSPEDSVVWRVAPALGAAGGPTPMTNRLAAFELATEGKLVWDFDGARPNGELAGAFFLGAPLVVDNSLLVMVEIRSAIYLVALEPRTGKLQWQQQLADLELGVGLDPLRRDVGSTPSYAGGILVCPTSAGVVVAVDVVRRELAWVYRYPRHLQSPTDRQPAWQRQVRNRSDREDDRWQDTAVLVADGRVLVASPESAELHCLDLRTGKLEWKHGRGNALFVACVDQGHVLLVGSDGIEALRLEDGSSVWTGGKVALPDGALPAGHGYLSEGRYFLPLTSGQVAAVDVGDGSIASLTGHAGESDLGNLICYRGSVISQSATVVDKFEQLDVLRRRAEAALAQDSNDPAALRDLAELRRADGDLPQAIDLLKRAHQLASRDPLTCEMLAESLLAALAADFASYRNELPLLRNLVRGREQQLTLLRIEAEGLEAMGDRPAAWAVYREIAGAASEPSLVEIDSNYSVRRDRWVAGRLATLWAEASADEWQVMADELAARRESLGVHPTTEQLREYLAHYGTLPGADEVRLQLARQLVDERFVQEAEVELLALGRSAAAESHAGAAALMVRLLVESDRVDEAQPYAAMLADRWGDEVVLDGLTGSQWLQRQGVDTPSSGAAVEHDWPRGQVIAEVQSTSPLRQGRVVRGVAPSRSLRQLRLEQDFPPTLDSLQWLITNDCSQLVGRDRSGRQVAHLDIERSGDSRAGRNNSDVVQAGRLGHLLYLALGDQIMATEAPAPDGVEELDVLWSNESVGGFATSRQRGPVRRVNVYDPRTGRRRYASSPRAAIGALGPVTPRGIVYQEERQLKCVDPLTGEVLWQRGDVPAACELFGDDQVVIAADVEDATALAIDMTDGHVRDQRSLPPLPWLLTAGRNVASIRYRSDPAGRRMAVRIDNVWSGEGLFAAEYSVESRLAVIEPDTVVIVEPTGEIHAIDVRTGGVVFEQRLGALPRLNAIHVMRSGERLFVFVDAHSRQQRHKNIGDEYPLVDGPVYALDARTGEPLWPGPALVKFRGPALAQPEDLPILVFVDRVINRDASGTSTGLRLLCIDKRSGRTVFRDDALPDTAGGLFEMRAQWDNEPRVSVETSSRLVQLTFTDQPRPPQPPANDELEAVRPRDERGLWGVGRRMGSALQNALQRPRGTGGNDRASDGEGRDQPQEADDD